MFRRPRPTPASDAPEPPQQREHDADDLDLDGGPIGAVPDLSALPIAGITRRRMAAVMSGVLAAWIVIVFARQVGEASAATARVDDIALANADLRGQVASLEREMDLIRRQRYVEQQARGYGLGTAREVAFSLAADAPPLPDDAPGSAAVRVGSDLTEVTPLERWLTVLFGPSD